MTSDKGIDQAALDSLSVAPDADSEDRVIHHPRQNAGQDSSIAERLAKEPADSDAKRDNALDESMDASDPPGTGSGDAAPSSGYDPDQEARRTANRHAL